MNLQLPNKHNTKLLWTSSKCLLEDDGWPEHQQYHPGNHPGVTPQTPQLLQWGFLFVCWQILKHLLWSRKGTLRSTQILWLLLNKIQIVQISKCWGKQMFIDSTDQARGCSME